jgi:hypothetical protein
MLIWRTASTAAVSVISTKQRPISRYTRPTSSATPLPPVTRSNVGSCRLPGEILARCLAVDDVSHPTLIIVRSAASLAHIQATDSASRRIGSDNFIRRNQPFSPSFGFALTIWIEFDRQFARWLQDHQSGVHGGVYEPVWLLRCRFSADLRCFPHFLCTGSTEICVG